jgi:hypothetical protein
VFDKLNQLGQAITSNTWGEIQSSQYQKLDEIITDSMLYAERQTGKSFSTRNDWSPILKQAVQAHRYWT